MFQLHLFYDTHNEEGTVVVPYLSDVAFVHRFTFKKITVEEMITKFVLNVILHHVGMSWII